MIICAVVVTILLSTMLSKKQGVQVTENDLEQKEDKNLPSFIQAVAGPVVVVILLAPIAGILMAGATASTTAGATIGAQTFAGTLIKFCFCSLYLHSALIHIPLYHSDKNTIGFAGLILVTIQCFIMIVSIYPTEKALKNILMMMEYVDNYNLTK